MKLLVNEMVIENGSLNEISMKKSSFDMEDAYPCKSPSNDTRAEEECKPPLQLIALVVHADEVNAAREKTSFEQSNQEAAGDKTPERVDHALSNGGDAPEYHDQRQPC